jgi:hypothetical protein
MLKRIFNFPREFDVLPEADFGQGNNVVKNVHYFGIDNKSNNEGLNNSVRVLFYDDVNHYAVSLTTNGGDEVILYRNPDEKNPNFSTIYENLIHQQFK